MAWLDEETCCFYEDVCTGSVQETHGARSPIFSLPMWYRETWGLLANSLLFPIPLKKLGARRFIFNIPCVLSRWRKLIEATLQGRSSICVPLRSIYCSAKRTIWKLFSEVSVKYQDLTFFFKFLPSVVPLFQIVQTLMICSWETKWPKKGQHRFQLIFWRIQCHILFFRQTYVQGVIYTPYSQADSLVTFYRTLSVFCPSGFWVMSHFNVACPLESSI